MFAGEGAGHSRGDALHVQFSTQDNSVLEGSGTGLAMYNLTEDDFGAIESYHRHPWAGGNARQHGNVTLKG